jgi:peptide/nickel transport system permease protein
MVRYAIRRVLTGLVLLFALSLLAFAMYRALPLPTGCLLVPCGPNTHSTDADLRAAEHKLGTDQPFPVQYAKFVWRIVRHGTFGDSFVHGPINPLIGHAVAPTISLLIGGMIILLVLAIPLGVVSALHAGERIDRLILALTVAGIAIHPFVLGGLLRRALAVDAGLAPQGGYCTLRHPPPFHPDPRLAPGAIPPPCGGATQWAWHMLLPWLTFALLFLPLYTRMIRARVLETLGAQHVVAARARGAPERLVIRSHVLRLALLPLMTMVGLELGAALMVSIYVESIFGLGGIGSLMIQSVSGDSIQFGYDLPLLASIFFCIAAFAIFLNLVIDLLYAWFDPRVRLA